MASKKMHALATRMRDINKFQNVLASVEPFLRYRQ